MITLLVDHDIEGHAIRLWDTFVAEGWLELFPIQMAMFADYVSRLVEILLDLDNYLGTVRVFIP